MDTSNFKSLTELNLSQVVDKEYIPFIEDLLRMLILQITIHFMYFVLNPVENTFFTTDILELLFYICIVFVYC